MPDDLYDPDGPSGRDDLDKLSRNVLKDTNFRKFNLNFFCKKMDSGFST